MGRPPKLDYSKKLTQVQKDRLVGGLLGDCWIEKQKGSVNVRVGLQQSVKNIDYVKDWMTTFEGWLEEKKKPIVEKSFDGKNFFDQYTSRTLAHPEFTLIYNVFKPAGATEKVVPAISWLKLNFSAISLADLHAQDGARKGIKAAAGFDYNTQGFGFEGSARFAIFLNEHFGLDAWPTRTQTKFEGETRYYWKVYVSSDSFDTLLGLIAPTLLAELLAAKSHPLGSSSGKTGPNPKNKAKRFLNMFAANQQLRENVFFKLTEAEISAYHNMVSTNSNNQIP